MNLDSIIEDIILATGGDVEKMDELITGGNENENDSTNNKQHTE